VSHRYTAWKGVCCLFSPESPLEFSVPAPTADLTWQRQEKASDQEGPGLQVEGSGTETGFALGFATNLLGIFLELKK
jgi:hypothetical protein